MIRIRVGRGWNGLALAGALALLSACGSSADPVPIVDTTDPRTVWVYTAPCGIYYSSPALSLDEQTVYIGTTFACSGDPDHALLALAADTGTLIWRYPLGAEPVRSSPVVAADGSIYFVTTAPRLIKLNANGNRLWELDLNPTAAPQTNAGQLAPALGADGTVYVGGDKLYAVRPDDGSILWQVTPIWPELLLNSPVVGPGGTVYFAFHNFFAAAYDGQTGARLWQLPNVPYGYNFAPPVTDAAGTVYLGTDEDGLRTISASGTQGWNFTGNTGYFLRSAPAIGADGALYFGSSAATGGTERAALFALDATGALLWSTIPPVVEYGPTQPSHFDIYSAPALGADGMLYFGHEFGSVYGVDPATGQVFWQYLTSSGMTWSSPAISSSGVLYIGNLAGDIYAIQTDSPGLSPTAIWPKSRFDNQNTGRWQAR